MRSADLRAGLTRVVALGGRTFESRSDEGLKISWRLLVPAALVLTVLLVATWHAGRGSGQLEGQRLSAQIDILTQKIASNQMELARQRKKISQFEQALSSSGKNGDVVRISQLRQQLLQAQAEANQYKTIIERERQESADNQSLLDTLSASGSRLLAMRGLEAAVESTAYALVSENGHLLFVASKLPKLEAPRQFQLWVLRKQEPKIVSAGVFRADDNSRAVFKFDSSSVLADLAQFQVTEEPEGGSSEPTGAKLLETTLPERSVEKVTEKTE